MIYATAPGEVLVTVTDEFVNNISLVISVLIECVIFAWLFNMEKLIAFLNANTRIMKIGKWWTVTVRYIIPIVLIVIWVGGVYELVTTSTAQHLIIIFSLTILALVMSLVFTKLPARTDSWLNAEERIE